MLSDIIVGLDIGTCFIKVIIAESVDNRIEVIGVANILVA